MKNSLSQKEKPRGLPARAFGALITFFALLLLTAFYLASKPMKKAVPSDSYHAAVYPVCSLCWYEWMAEQANQKQKP